MTPLGRRTVLLWAAEAHAALSIHDGSAVRPPASARDCRLQSQATAGSLRRRPSGALARCCPLTNFGSSVERTAKLHPLCKRGNGSSGLFRARSGRRAAGGESDEGANCSLETACVASRPSSRQQPGATAARAVDRILLRRLLDGAFGAWSGRRTSTLQRLEGV
jgi:hypothetical protein